MKYNEWVLVLLFIIIIPVMAFSVDFSVGLRAGIGLPHHSGSDFKDMLDFWGIEQKFNIGFTGGVFSTIGIMDFLAIQPEILFTMAGSKIGDDNAFLRLKMNLLEIPILVKGRFDVGKAKINIFAGPALMIKIGDYITVDDDGNEYPENQDDYNTMMLSIVLGAGVDIPVGPGFFVIDERYNIGLKSIYNEDEVGDYNEKQNNFSVTLGYGIKIM